MDPNLRRRIEVLELEVRRWKLLTVVVLIAMTVLLLAAAAPPDQMRVFPEDPFVQQVPAGRLSAHDFTLVGKDGKPSARLFIKKDEPSLEFYDAKGEVIWSAPPSHGFTPVQLDAR
jgi:hypothetical protein